MPCMKSLCVFCGSQVGDAPKFSRAAGELGKLLARKRISLVYGGGGIGLMGILADAALKEGGKVIGVIPHPLFGREVAHRSLTELREVRSMHERKTLMYDLSDGFIALPGGLGTLEETFEILTWAQLGLHRKPCGLLNVNGYFDPLLRFLDDGTEKGFIKRKHRDLLIVDDDPSSLLDRFAAWKPLPAKAWIREEEV